jgi:preprotein translocase subunit Sss1
MIRLTLAVGFLVVFGIVGYAVVLLLTNYFSNHNKPNNKPNN